MPNTISGRVVLKETGDGIPDLLVVMYDVDPNGFSDDPFGLPPLSPVSANPRTAGERLGSVLTGPDGRFELAYEDTEFQMRIPQEARPDLLLMVLAPEEPGVEPEAEPLYVAPSVRRNAGRTEQVLIRLSAERLMHAGIAAVLDRGAAAAAAVTAAPSFDTQMRAALTAAIVAAARGAIDPERLVPAGASVFGRNDALIRFTLEGGFHPRPGLPRATCESEDASFDLRLAFDHLCQIQVDEEVIARAEDAFDAIVSRGGNPDRAEWRGLPPLLALKREARRLLRHSPAAAAEARPITSLLAGLEGLTHRKCAFTSFAADPRERSVNLGVLRIHRKPAGAESKSPPRAFDEAARRAGAATFKPVSDLRRGCDDVPRQHAARGALMPVVLVAQEMPAPHEVDEHWFAAHESVLRRVWLDAPLTDDVARLIVHVRQNILHYMQAIWAFELADDRYMRLHAVPVPTFTADEPPSESLTYAPLGAIADLDALVGFMGNYMVLPLLAGNVITNAIAGTMPAAEPEQPLAAPLEGAASASRRKAGRAKNAARESAIPRA